MSIDSDIKRDPRNALFDNFFKRMEAKKAQDAREEAQLAEERRRERERQLAEDANDQGPEDFTIGNQDGKVLMVFPHAVDWLGWTPEEAIIVAHALTENAAAALHWRPPGPQESPPDAAPGLAQHLPGSEAMDKDFSTGLPRYQCHKIVRAAKIVAIDHGERLDLAPHGVVEVGVGWIGSKGAEVGGYYVLYDDGYASYSPAKAFEEGYRPIPVVPADPPPASEAWPYASDRATNAQSPSEPLPGA